MKLWLTLALCCSLSSCAIGLGPNPPEGLLFSSYQGPIHANPGKVKHAKTGESCSMLILYLITIGDSSVATAKDSGGIKKVAVVDYKKFSLLNGLYSKVCTIVTGM